MTDLGSSYGLTGSDAVNGSEGELDYFSGVLNLGSLLRRGKERVVRLGFIIILKKSSIFAL